MMSFIPNLWSVQTIYILIFLNIHHGAVFISASKGFWAEMLGVGDFYYELGIQIVEVCMATSKRNGGDW